MTLKSSKLFPQSRHENGAEIGRAAQVGPRRLFVDIRLPLTVHKSLVYHDMVKFNGIIQRKLALLDTQVINLKKHLKGVARDSFVNDWMRRSMTERALQVATEIVIDIAERIIALNGAGPVVSAADAIKKLVELEILESEVPFVDMVRFRNLIVHEYEEINPNLLFELATERLDDFALFRREIDSLG